MLREIFRDNRRVFSILYAILAMMALNRVSGGWGLLVLVLLSMSFIARRKMGAVALCYTFLTFIINLNSSLVGGVNSLAYRISFVLMTALVVVQGAQRRGTHTVPLIMIYPFLLVCVISSMHGYCPVVSYLKLLNFVLFLFGMHFVTRNLHHYPDQIQTIRLGFQAFAVLLIAGSIAVMPFPAIGYSMMVGKWNVDSYYASTLLNDAIYSGRALYSGVTNHSQALAPFVVCISAWLLCDMLLVERRFCKLHIALLACVPILLYKTRSRVGLLGMVMTICIVCFYTLPASPIAPRMKQRIKSGFFAALMILLCVAIVSQISGGAMSKWIRKTQETEADKRDLSEAVTASRQGSIESNLYDFRQNMAWGTGFQVSYEIGQMYKRSSSIPLSAPIEKGVLPLMILGETGIIGAFAFLIFLSVFTMTCIVKKYVATLTLFYVMLVCNMGEATLFAPTAIGGCFWLVSCAGGFAIDMYCLYFRNQSCFAQSIPYYCG